MPPQLAYTLFMFLALGVFLLARHFTPKTVILSWKQRLVLGWAILVGAALGAKLGFVIAYQQDWSTSDIWLTHGKSVTTALIGAYLAVEVAKLFLGIHVSTGDGYALPTALALAVGRWGCFFNGCCHGVPTSLPWGVDFGDGPRHPTQVYESLFHLLMAGVLVEITRRDQLRQHHLKFYLIAYGVFRFAMEFIRPEPDWWLGLSFYQWACLGMVVGLSVQWWTTGFAGRKVPQSIP